MFSISSLDCEIFMYVGSSNLKPVCSCDNSISEVFSLIHILYILFERGIPLEFLQQLLFTFYKVIYLQWFCMLVFYISSNINPAGAKYVYSVAVLSNG